MQTLAMRRRAQSTHSEAFGSLEAPRSHTVAERPRRDPNSPG
jgi:hypothetical protein